MRILYKLDQYCQQRQREKKRWIWPVHLAMEATYYKDEGHQVVWDDLERYEAYEKIELSPEGLPFAGLPMPNLELTNAFDPKYQNNGNYKHHPGIYIQSAAGCWWGKCVFCKENGCPYQLRPVDKVLDEIRIRQRQGYREVFDDAASLAVDGWRERLIDGLKDIDIAFSCNMRFGTNPDFKAMKQAGFRMLLYGLESANQDTLDRVNKGVDIFQAVDELELASSYGLEPHIAVMFGYPWEKEKDTLYTLELVQDLLRAGIVKTAQASVYDVPGQGYDLSARKYVSQIYHAAFYPDFWYNKLKDIRTLDDIKYIGRGIKSWLGI